MISFNPHNSTVLFPFYKRESWDIDKGICSRPHSESSRCGSNLKLLDSKILGFKLSSYYKGIEIIQVDIMRFFTWTTGSEKGGAGTGFKSSVEGASVGL